RVAAAGPVIGLPTVSVWPLPTPAAVPTRQVWLAPKAIAWPPARLMVSGWVATDRSMPPAPRVNPLPPIDTGFAPAVPGTAPTVILFRPRTTLLMSLTVARLAVLLASKATAVTVVPLDTPAVQLPALLQLADAAPVQEVDWAGAAEARVS